MQGNVYHARKARLRLVVLVSLTFGISTTMCAADRPRVIVTSDGEIDDECSLVRFLLYANEFDVEGLITSSSQYHAHGHRWAGDDWMQPYLDAYAKVYPNLIKHDTRYPSPEFLQDRTLLGNVKAEGEMDEVTAGSKRIAEVLLDQSDPRPVWIQAWGGTNTIARALKSIEEEHPVRMAQVAKKIRLYLIWEQDETYQKYIRPHWGKHGIETVISDQFIAIFYHWKKYVPAEHQEYLVGSWMKDHILESHGPLCSLYKAHKKEDEGFSDGDFRSEGDSPAFLYNIPNGLRSNESPGYGGWGGRFVRVRENTWLDPVAEPAYEYPQGRWFGNSAWGRTRLKRGIRNDAELIAYLKPQWRWIDAIQNDFAARADWCVKPFEEANHAPLAELAHERDITVAPGTVVELNAELSSDPDGDQLSYRWWQYGEADSAKANVVIRDATQQKASFVAPNETGIRVYIILEVTDNGAPPLVNYQRVICTIAEATAATTREITRNELKNKIRGYWLGQLTGNYFGFPFELLYIQDPVPVDVDKFYTERNNGDLKIKTDWRGNMDHQVRDRRGAPSDDDHDLEFLTLHAVEKYGLDITYDEIAPLLDKHVKRMVWVSTEHAVKAIRNGAMPPSTGTKQNNPYWHDLMASISTEIWGSFYPGMTQKAADGAEWFARISNDDYAVYLAKFYASMYSAAFFESDHEELIRIGLKQVPQDNILYQGIRDVQEWSAENSDWRDTRKLIYDKYYSKEKPKDLSSIVDALPNGLMGIMALLYAEGDFKKTLSISASAGLDSDKQPATLGGLIGVIGGADRFPEDYKMVFTGNTKSPFYGTYVNHTRDGLPERTEIEAIVDRIAVIAEKAILANGGEKSVKPNGETVYIIKTDI